MQIADATLECPPGRTMLRDTLFHRLLIGQGELPNLEVLKILEEAGHIASVGPEIFSAEPDKLSGDRTMATIMPGFEDLLVRLGAGRGWSSAATREWAELP